MNRQASLPQDIKHYDWLNLIRSMQAEASKNNGLAIIEVRVLVDSSGKPVSWTEPRMTKIEPWRRAQVVIDLLTDGKCAT